MFANIIGPVTLSTGAAGASGLELTTVWTIAAALQHYWTPALRSSVFGAYTATDYNANATNIFCSSPVGPVRTFAACDAELPHRLGSRLQPRLQRLGLGTRTIWNPVPNLDIGVEVVYSKLETRARPGSRRGF